MLDIKAGQIFTEENLTTKRPGTGISPMEWNNLIGKKSSRNYCVDELIDEA
jgi:N,N'-diacetyllegionaminate synthase